MAEHQKYGHPGSAHVPKMPGVHKTPEVKKVVSLPAPQKTGVVNSTKGDGHYPVYPHPDKMHPGSASHPSPSKGGSKSGAYGLHKKYNY